MHESKSISIQTGIIFVIMMVAFLVFVGPSAAAEGVFDPNHTLYDGVLKGFVKEGLVNYAGLKENPESLNQYLADLSQVKEQEFKSWNELQQIAYLVNLYNAATLKLIVNNYPVKSIKDIGSFFKGPWGQPVVRLFGKTITLNTLEHKIIRVDYDESRVHLALVCAAMGCPPLRGEAYTSKKLNAQLDDQAKVFLKNPIKFRIDRQDSTIYLSPIFKWYGEDFVDKFTPEARLDGLNKTERAVLNFCSWYLSDADQKYLAAGGYSVRYLDYNWSLNEKKVKK
jgi:hypothetical protein